MESLFITIAVKIHKYLDCVSVLVYCGYNKVYFASRVDIQMRKLEA